MAHDGVRRRAHPDESRAPLTPDAAATEIGDYKSARAVVEKMILDRAPASAVIGGHAALRAAVDQLLDAWEALAKDKRLHDKAWLLEVPGFADTGPDAKNVQILKKCF